MPLTRQLRRRCESPQPSARCKRPCCDWSHLDRPNQLYTRSRSRRTLRQHRAQTSEHQRQCRLLPHLHCDPVPARIYNSGPLLRQTAIRCRSMMINRRYQHVEAVLSLCAPLGRLADLEALRSIISRVATITGHSVSLRKQRASIVTAASAEPGPDDAVQASSLTARSLPFMTSGVCHSAFTCRETPVELQLRAEADDWPSGLLCATRAYKRATLFMLQQRATLGSMSRLGNKCHF